VPVKPPRRGFGLSLGTLLFRFGSPVRDAIVSGNSICRSSLFVFSHAFEVDDLGHLVPVC
jgi:hypothetical protein